MRVIKHKTPIPFVVTHEKLAMRKVAEQLQVLLPPSQRLPTRLS
jgi:hypothetical protein